MNIGLTMKKGVTFHNPFKSDNGYTLICPKYSKDMWLIDIEGHIINRWQMPYLPAGHGRILENGNFFYGGQLKTNKELGLPPEFSALGGILMEVDWDGNIVWQTEVPYQHHDFQVTKNDHIIYTTHIEKSILPDDYAEKLKGGIEGTEYEGKVWGDAVIEIDRNGEVIWEWIAHEHLDPEIDDICPLETRAKWPVINSLWICQDGNILLSLRVPSEVIKIEYKTGKVLGRYGKGKIYHQHDARELKNGNILVFDNGNHRPNYNPSYSRVVEINLERDEIVWEYKGNPPSDFYSAVAAGSERLSNGNTMICDAQMGRVFEVTEEKEVVWEYVSPFRNMKQDQYTNFMWRAHRYSCDYRGLRGKDLDPKRFPWENRLYGPDTIETQFSPFVF